MAPEILTPEELDAREKQAEREDWAGVRSSECEPPASTEDRADAEPAEPHSTGRLLFRMHDHHIDADDQQSQQPKPNNNQFNCCKYLVDPISNVTKVFVPL